MRGERRVAGVLGAVLVMGAAAALAACGGAGEQGGAQSAATAGAAGAVVAEGVWARPSRAAPMPPAADTATEAVHTTAADSAHTGSAGMSGMHATGPRQTSAVYLVLRNPGTEADRLLAAETEVAQTVEIHESAIDERGVMRMRQLQGGLEIPAGGQVELKPGGYHLMLIDLTRPLAPGERFPVLLRLERAGELRLEAEVRQP